MYALAEEHILTILVPPPACTKSSYRPQKNSILPRPSSYPLLGLKYPLLGTIYPQLRVQGGSWNISIKYVGTWTLWDALGRIKNQDDSERMQNRCLQIRAPSSSSPHCEDNTLGYIFRPMIFAIPHIKKIMRCPVLREGLNLLSQWPHFTTLGTASSPCTTAFAGMRSGIPNKGEGVLKPEAQRQENIAPITSWHETRGYFIYYDL